MNEPNISLLKANWNSQYDLIKLNGSKNIFHDGLIGRVHNITNGLSCTNGVSNDSDMQVITDMLINIKSKWLDCIVVDLY